MLCIEAAAKIKTSTTNRAGVWDPHVNFGHRRDQRSFVVAETKLNNSLCFVYTWPAVCTVQLINTWCQANLCRDIVEYSENREP